MRLESVPRAFLERWVKHQYAYKFGKPFRAFKTLCTLCMRWVYVMLRSHLNCMTSVCRTLIKTSPERLTLCVLTNCEDMTNVHAAPYLAFYGRLFEPGRVRGTLAVRVQSLQSSPNVFIACYERLNNIFRAFVSVNRIECHQINYFYACTTICFAFSVCRRMPNVHSDERVRNVYRLFSRRISKSHECSRHAGINTWVWP